MSVQNSSINPFRFQQSFDTARNYRDAFRTALTEECLEELDGRVKVLFDSRVDIGRGGYFPTKPQGLLVVGMSGLDAPDISGMRDLIDRRILTSKLLFHEFRHVDQGRTGYRCRDNGKYAVAMKLDDISCRTNLRSYGFDEFCRPTGRYFDNIREIDAEMDGVACVFEFMKKNPDLFGDPDDVEQMFCDFMNRMYGRG